MRRIDLRNSVLVSFNELPITFNELVEIGRNWPKLTKIGRNWLKLAEVGENCQKFADFDENCLKKSDEIDENWKILEKIGV